LRRAVATQAAHAMVNFKLARGPNSLSGVGLTPEEQPGAYVSKKTKATHAGSESLRGNLKPQTPNLRP